MQNLTYSFSVKTVFLLLALFSSLLALIEDFSYLFGNLINFYFTFCFMQYHIVSNILSLEPSIPTFCILCFSVKPWQIKLFVGRPFNSLAANVERSVSLFSVSEKPYSFPHCNLTAAAAEMHILSTILFDRSLESVGVDMP